MAQGFAHHGARHAKTVAEHPLHQTLAGAELKAQNRVAQPLDREFAQGAGLPVDPQNVVWLRRAHAMPPQ